MNTKFKAMAKLRTGSEKTSFSMIYSNKAFYAVVNRTKKEAEVSSSAPCHCLIFRAD